MNPEKIEAYYRELEKDKGKEVWKTLTAFWDSFEEMKESGVSEEKAFIVLAHLIAKSCLGAASELD
jgi:hypothetical protein